MVRFSEDNSFDPFNLVKETWEMLVFLCYPRKVGECRSFPETK